MSAEKKPRSARFTSEMSDALVQAYQKNQYILQAKFSDTVSYDKKQHAWREVVNSVNAVNQGEKKDINQVKRRWEDLAGTVKKKGREAKNKELKRLRVTGNGHLEDEDDGDFSKPCTEAFNPLEQQIANILGPQTFTGIPGGHDSLDTLVAVPNKTETGNKSKAMEADVQEVSVTDGNNYSTATMTIKDSKPVGLAQNHLGQKRRRPAKTLAEAQLEYFETVTSYYRKKIEKLELEINLLKEQKREVQTTATFGEESPEFYYHGSHSRLT